MKRVTGEGGGRLMLISRGRGKLFEGQIQQGRGAEYVKNIGRDGGVGELCRLEGADDRMYI